MLKNNFFIILMNHKFLLITSFVLIAFYFMMNTEKYIKKGTKTESDENLIEEIMKSNPEKFDKYLKNAEKYKIQVHYTQIDRDSLNQPQLTTYRFRPDEYFFMASLVKLPLSALCLEKINQLDIEGLERDTRMHIKRGYACQSAVSRDYSSPSGYPTIENYIKKALIVSNNDASNRMYEFLGQQHINERLWKMGYSTARVLSRFDPGCGTKANRYTNPIDFIDDKGNVIYSQEMLFNPKEFTGKGNEGDVTISGKNFSSSNYIALEDLHNIMIAIIMPEAVPKKQRFDIADNDMKFLRKTLSTLPAEGLSGYENTNDNFMKYLLLGTSPKMPHPDLRIFNKVGLSYGFMSDVAYIVDYDKKVEFFLSASIYANANGIFGDSRYEYGSVARPFLGTIGRAIYQYELKRERKFKPKLKKYNWGKKDK